MTHNYAVLHTLSKGKQHAVLRDRPASLQKASPLQAGKPVGDLVAPDTGFGIDKKMGEILLDVLPNSLGYLMVSKPAREVLQAEGVENVEYLPIQVLDKQRQPKSSDYCIANVLDPVDCLDRDASVYRDSNLAEGHIAAIKRLCLVQEQIPEHLKLFRLEQSRHTFIIRDDLVEQLNNHGITGVKTLALGSDVFLP